MSSCVLVPMKQLQGKYSKRNNCEKMPTTRRVLCGNGGECSVRDKREWEGKERNVCVVLVNGNG